MSPVTHFFTGWVLANCAELNRKDRALVTWACVIPDVDGLGIIPEVLYSKLDASAVVVHAVPPLTTQSDVRFGGHHTGACRRHTKVGDRPVRAVELPLAFARRHTGFPRAGRLSVANSLSAAVLLFTATRVAWGVGTERVAQCGDHCCAVVGHAVVGMAARFLALGNDIR